MSDLWEDCLEKSEEKTVFGTTAGLGIAGPRRIRFSVAVRNERLRLRNPDQLCAVGKKRLFSLRARRVQTGVRPGEQSGVFLRRRAYPDHSGRVTTEYRSVMAFGTVACSLPESERLSALDLLVDKYSADFKDIAAKYIAGSFHRTEILRLDIEHLSGKHKELHK